MHRTFRLPPRRPAPFVPGRRPGLTGLAGGHPALPPLGLTPEKPGVALRAINLHTSPSHDGTACVSPAPGDGAGARARSARGSCPLISNAATWRQESKTPPPWLRTLVCSRTLRPSRVSGGAPPPVGAGHVPARKRTCEDTQTNLETASARTRSKHHAARHCAHQTLRVRALASHTMPPATAHTSRLTRVRYAGSTDTDSQQPRGLYIGYKA